MNKISAEKIGDLGEVLARDYLQSSGFELVQFGKAISHENRIVKTMDGLPLLPDYSIGSSFGQFSFSPEIIGNPWQDSDIPAWADLSKEEIAEFAVQCSMRKSCGIRDNKRSDAPCACIDKFLDRDWLTSIEPHNPRSVRVSVNGVPLVLKGHNIIEICLQRINGLLISKYKDNVRSISSFVAANIVTTEYIKRKEWRDSELHGGLGDNLPHSGSAITDALRSGRPAEAERLKEENRVAMKKKPRYKSAIGHPGRYDFVGYKNSDHYAIEVKVNSSVLSHWQNIRLGILKMLGVKTLLLHVKIENFQLLETGSSKLLIPPVFTEIYDPQLENSGIPSVLDIQEVLNFRAKHERAMDLRLSEDMREKLGYE